MCLILNNKSEVPQDEPAGRGYIDHLVLNNDILQAKDFTVPRFSLPGAPDCRFILSWTRLWTGLVDFVFQKVKVTLENLILEPCMLVVVCSNGRGYEKGLICFLVSEIMPMGEAAIPSCFIKIPKQFVVVVIGVWGFCLFVKLQAADLLGKLSHACWSVTITLSACISTAEALWQARLHTDMLCCMYFFSIQPDVGCCTVPIFVLHFPDSWMWPTNAPWIINICLLSIYLKKLLMGLVPSCLM